MPANSAPTWVCRIDDRKTKPFSQPEISLGSWMTRGRLRGACTTALPELRPKASLPESSTAKLRLLLSTFGKGCDGSRTDGRQHWHQLVEEEVADPVDLLRGPVGAPVETDALFGQGRQDIAVEQIVLTRHQRMRQLRYLLVDGACRDAVRTFVMRIQAQLFLEAREADLEEFVHVAGKDAQEAQAFKRGVLGSSAWARTRRLNSRMPSSRLIRCSAGGR
jgi:hypothetical protein